MLGIPVLKLRYNSGFIVTPAEIRSALARQGRWLDGTPSPVPDPAHWDRWLRWLEEASENDGFEVR